MPSVSECRFLNAVPNAVAWHLERRSNVGCENHSPNIGTQYWRSSARALIRINAASSERFHEFHDDLAMIVARLRLMVS
jgi:hypothetical protein